MIKIIANGVLIATLTSMTDGMLNPRVTEVVIDFLAERPKIYSNTSYRLDETVEIRGGEVSEIVLHPYLNQLQLREFSDYLFEKLNDKLLWLRFYCMSKKKKLEATND